MDRIEKIFTQQDIDNYIVQSILTDGVMYSNDLYNFTCGSYSRALTKIIAKLTKYKCSIALPLKYNEKTIALIFLPRTSIEPKGDQYKRTDPVLFKIS